MPASRGSLKVFVGMAAGVGKTYDMLREGQDRRRAGEDVVIGWHQPHGRPETAAQAEGLEVVPPRVVEYRGIELAEMDTEAVLARRPQVALVDELAHTNAPGARHFKRYADVLELLDAGIDVLSTVNVQHLESLNDQVFELTGVRVKETIPDQVLLEADEVVLVDLTPEALRARLQDGKVYPLDRVDRALLNFFTVHNLSTLREVSLREVAGAVDERLQRGEPPPARADEPGAHGVGLAERVMVLARPERGSQRLVRRGWRTARRLGAELDVVCLEEPRDEESRRQRELLRSLSVTLGAHFVTVVGEDLPDEIVQMARARGVSRLVMGIPGRRGLLGRLKRDLLTDLIDRLEGVDVILMAERRGEDG